MTASVDDDLEDLLGRYIESYEQLEILLFLRERASEEWSCARIAERLRIDADQAGSALEHLAARSILERRSASDAQYRYAPSVAGLAEKIARLAAAYGGDERLAVMSIMNRNAVRRLREGAARVFADAFVL